MVVVCRCASCGVWCSLFVVCRLLNVGYFLGVVRSVLVLVYCCVLVVCVCCLSLYVGRLVVVVGYLACGACWRPSVLVVVRWLLLVVCLLCVVRCVVVICWLFVVCCALLICVCGSVCARRCLFSVVCDVWFVV